MRVCVTRKGDRWYAVVYAGLDQVTGKERRSWHPAGTLFRGASPASRPVYPALVAGREQTACHCHELGVSIRTTTVLGGQARLPTRKTG